MRFGIGVLSLVLPAFGCSLIDAFGSSTEGPDAGMSVDGKVVDAKLIDGPAENCAGAIYGIKNGTTPVGSQVRVANALVTSRAASGFTIQVKEIDACYAGPDFSGLFVATSMLSDVVFGARVTVEGTVTNQLGQLHLASVTSVVKQAGPLEGQPAPIGAVVADVATTGPRAAALEAMLITLGRSTVTAVSPPANEFTVSAGPGSLVVDDLLFANAASIGQELTTSTGILLRQAGASKLNPRSAADLVFDPRFVCAGAAPATTAIDPVTVSGTASKPFGGSVNAITIELRQLSNDALVVSGVTNTMGVFSVAGATGGNPLNAYIKATRGDLVITRAYAPDPLTQNLANVPMLVYTPPELSQLATLGGATFDTTRAIVGVRITDCQGTPIEGAVVTTNPPAGKVTYLDPGNALTATSPSGEALAINVPAGPVTVNATANGRTWRAVMLPTFANELALTTLHP